MSSLALVLIQTPMHIAEAQTTTSTISNNLLNYEWTQSTSDASRSFASAGPGPDSFNILWRTNIPGVISQPIAFDGKVFVQDNSVYYGTGSTTYCLDAGTGQILWKISAAGSIIKLDNTYMLLGNNAYKIADGTLAWTAPTGFMIDYYTFNGLTQLNGIGYDSALKTFFTGSLMSPALQAWSLPDASKPPTLLWNRATQSDYGKYGSETNALESQGVVVCDTSYEYLLGINATTGKTIWATPIHK